MRKTACLVLITAISFLAGWMLRSPRQVLAQDTTITDPAAADCPAEDKPPVNTNIPPLGRGNYPYPSERPTRYSQPDTSLKGQIQMDLTCSPSPESQNCLASVKSHLLRFIYLDTPCPKGFTSDSSGCYTEVFVASNGTATPPSLVPGSYYIYDTAGCWQPQNLEVKSGCTFSGGLQCLDGSGPALTCTGGTDQPLATPSPPPPANKEEKVLNGVPVAGQGCAKEESTPIRFPEGFCVAGGQDGQLRLLPKTVQAPFAQDTGQYLTGILDYEHLTRTELNLLYDKVLGLPGITLPISIPFIGNRLGLPAAKGISVAWNLSDPIHRLAPQLEQDRLKHEFLKYLCQPTAEAPEGRAEQLNTRYPYRLPTFWYIEAPLLGTQVKDYVADAAKKALINICASFPPPPLFSADQMRKDVCPALVSWLGTSKDPISVKTCEIYKNEAKWPSPGIGPIGFPFPEIFPIKDVYKMKMETQCKYPDGTAIPNCTKKAMYTPNFVEQAVWDRVPLFANEESKGEVEFKVCGSDKTVKIETSVPQVFRLASASAFLQQMLLSASDSAKYKKTSFQPAAAGPLECPGCPDAQAGPPDTEMFIDYKDNYNSGNRGKVNYQGGGTGTSPDKKGISVYNNVPFLLSIWYQTAGGPFGVFNILRPYRPLDQFVTGLFQPSGKPFASEGQFLDTPGSDPVQYEGANIQPDVWKLLFSKLGGVWNAKNWLMQSVAPY